MLKDKAAKLYSSTCGADDGQSKIKKVHFFIEITVFCKIANGLTEPLQTILGDS